MNKKHIGSDFDDFLKENSIIPFSDVSKQKLKNPKFKKLYDSYNQQLKNKTDKKMNKYKK